ncbi:hypothetical protein A3E49_00625 [Candidatus Saccharibacteria bacterium RIFCSPHIGHO2_12_FULL_49_19]|nr:MAG: hypothetical protein A3E49_00625 [Candidatus Saccharibacteria bacterium RIFCSPHIGHO2_12_FULL_49_19]
MSKHNEPLPLLGRDINWDDIDGEILHVLHFAPFAKVINGEVKTVTKSLPYAFLNVISFRNKLKAQLWVTHKIDFENLWKVYNEIGLSDNEEVNVIWTNKNYRSKLVSPFKAALPKLIVWVNHKGAWKLIHGITKNSLTGTAAYKAEAPIVEYKPEIME